MRKMQVVVWEIDERRRRGALIMDFTFQETIIADWK